jgi:hypothetical protein
LQHSCKMSNSLFKVKNVATLVRRAKKRTFELG